MKHSLLFLFLMLVPRFESAARQATTDPEAAWQIADSLRGNDSITADETPPLKGFTTSAGRTSYVSSIGNYSSADYDFWFGFGYNLTRRLLVGIRIYTGSEQTSPDKTFPFSGKFSMGGGSVNVLWRLPITPRLQPFLEAGIQLSTILSSAGNVGATTGQTSGYNGRAVQISAGTEYFLYDSFSLHGEFLYRHRHYIDVIVAGENMGNRSTFMDNGYGIGLGCNLYFNLIP